MKIQGSRIYRIISIVLLLGVVFLYAFMTVHMNRVGDELYTPATEAGMFLRSLFHHPARRTLFTAFCITFAVSLLLFSFCRKESKVRRIVYKNRWAFAIGMILLITVLEVNNTSLYEWQSHAGMAAEQVTSPLWGVSRAIRSDEWSTWAPLVFSQSEHGYPAVNQSTAFAALDTAWISIGGVPAFSVAGVFKPFYWGFLLLGISKGFAFLFACRIVFLFLISYDVAEYYTHNNRYLSAAAAVLITFSPFIQWWFSQSVSEVLIFGQGIVLFLLKMCGEKRKTRRYLFASLAAYCVGAFIMIGYVGWLISAVYMILPVCAIILRHYEKKTKVSEKVYTAIPFVVVAALIFIIVRNSWGTLQAVLNSDYPGKRLMTGGNQWPSLYSGLYSIFLPFVQPNISNWCECAGWITFAPAGLVLSVHNMVKQRKPDGISIVCIGVQLLFLLFSFVRFPEWLVKITFLSQVNRPGIIIGLADVVLLFRALSVKEKAGPVRAILTGALMTFLQMAVICSKYTMDLPLKLILIVIHMIVYPGIFMAGRETEQDRAGRYSLSSLRYVACCFMLVALIGGAFVNPLQKGVDCINELSVIKGLKEIGGKEDLWCIDDWENIPLMAGKKVVSSTQYYPNPDFWSQLDPEGKQRSVYNRFCHMDMEIVDEETTFVLRNEDAIHVKMSIQDLAGVNVRYFMTRKLYPDEWEGTRWNLIDQIDGYYIYRLPEKHT